MALSEQDKGMLRELARRLAEVAALPDQQERVRLWKAMNRLQPERPMVMIDQVCWNEMSVNGELALQVEDEFWQGMEMYLRCTLYQWEHMRVDMVVEPFLSISRTVQSTGYGVWINADRAVLDPQSAVAGQRYHDTIKTDEDVARIQTPVITSDADEDARRAEQAHELFDGIMETRMQGPQPNFAPWDLLAMARSPEAILYDLVDRPDFTHRIMERLTEAKLSELDQMEELGLLGHSHRTVHCSGAHTDELPGAGFDPEHVRPSDMWTSGMAQIFSTVGPDMHQEFELAYANRWYERFGLVYYGCCEPLDGKVGIIREIPNVRKVSMSPWVDVERAAAGLGSDLVFSRKPSPAFLAVDNWSADAVREDLQNTKDICDAHGCPLEFILKDISTVHHEPQRLWEWADIAMEVAGA